MDILSHGLWSAAAYKAASLPPRKPKKIWWAVFFGLAPDFFSFGIVFVSNLITYASLRPHFVDDTGPNPDLVPNYVHGLYNITHSLIIFGSIFLLVWLIRKKPFLEMGAWGLHILMDIPTHTSRFFPTPFLWPLSSLKVSVISWAEPWFLITNYIVLTILLFTLFRRKKS